MPYKNRVQHNTRRKENVRIKAIKKASICAHCQSTQAYLLTIDIDKLSVREIKKTPALCLNCLSRQTYQNYGDRLDNERALKKRKG